MTYLVIALLPIVLFPIALAVVYFGPIWLNRRLRHSHRAKVG